MQQIPFPPCKRTWQKRWWKKQPNIVWASKTQVLIQHIRCKMQVDFNNSMRHYGSAECKSSLLEETLRGPWNTGMDITWISGLTFRSACNGSRVLHIALTLIRSLHTINCKWLDSLIWKLPQLVGGLRPFKGKWN